MIVIGLLCFEFFVFGWILLMLDTDAMMGFGLVHSWMAFFNKFGSLVRQSVSQNGQVPMASMLNSIRCMSSSKLFIGGIDV